MSEQRSYDDFEKEYDQILSRIRAFLASTRSISTLNECQRLITDAKRCAHAMLGLAEVSNDNIKIQKAKRCLEQEIEPLSNEVSRCLAEKNSNTVVSSKKDLFNGADIDKRKDLNMLLKDSNSMLQESQRLCFDSEQVATSTLETMTRQRSQLENASGFLDQTLEVTNQAGEILRDMSYKALRNKIFLYSVIALLIAANLYALYRVFTK